MVSPLRRPDLIGLRRVPFIIWLAVSVATTSAGPFDTREAMTTGVRALFWGTIVAVSIYGSIFANRVADSIAERHQHLRHGAAVAVIIATIITPVIWWLGHLLPSDESFEVPRPALLYFEVLLIVVAITVIKRVLPLRPDGGGQTAEEPGETARLPRLAERLKNGENSVILRLTVRDHCVDVVTDKGVETLRMRFADAVREMEPVEGYCVHRSHWVGRAAIHRVCREGGGRVFVELCNGDRVPVSRRYRPNLEAAGLV